MNTSRSFSKRCLGLLLLCLVSMSFAQPEDFISYHEEREVSLSQEARQRLDSLKARSTTISVRLIQFRNLSTLASRQQLRIPVQGAGTLVATAARIKQREASKLLWSGVLPDNKNRVFFSVADGAVTGMIHLDQAVFAVEPLEAGYHVLIGLDQSKFGPDDPPESNSQNEQDRNEEAQALRARLSKPDLQASIASTASIDILVAYTPAVASASGNVASLIYACEQSANETLSNSSVNAELYVVHSVQVSYTESGNTGTDVNRLQGTNDGYMDNIHSLRDLYGADVVVLLISYANNAVGQAYNIGVNASGAYCVVEDNAAVGNYTFAHEIGHLIGGRHNNDPSGTYEHGYVYSPAYWRTVMAVPQTGVNRIPYWSSPNQTYGGVAMGTTSTNDNFRKWNERASTVAWFKSPMYVTITGPTILEWKHNGTWTANPSVSGVSYAYEWRFRNAGDPNWSSVVSTSQTYTRQMLPNDMELQVKATAQGAVAYDTHYVEEGIPKAAAPTDESTPLPEKFSLSQNYPNPFNPETIIRFDLPEAAAVQLVIFDLAGREVRRLIEESMTPGYHHALWDGKDQHGNHAPSGVYVYQIIAGNFRGQKKLALVR
jgi:hypothetical protein